MIRGLGIVFVGEKMMAENMGHFIWIGLQREVRAPAREGVRKALLLLLQLQAVPLYYPWKKPP